MKEQKMEKQMAEVMAENRRLVEPLQKAREEVEDLKKKLANYDKDKQALINAKARLKVLYELLVHWITFSKALTILSIDWQIKIKY